MSAIYLDQARSAYQQSDWTTAERLTRIALEFNPNNSDALYLRAETQARLPQGIPEAIGSYQEALSRNEWTQFSAAACRMKLAPLLIRTKQYARAIGLLTGAGSTNADYFYQMARALIGDGKRLPARNLLMEAAQAYPKDAHFPILRLRIDPTYADAMAHQYLSPASAAALPQPVFEALVESVRSMALKRSVLAAYASGHTLSPLLYGQSLLAAQSVTPKEISQYAADGLLSNASLTLSLFRHLPTGGAKSQLATTISSYSGSVHLDSNNDGFSEETASYSSGVLQGLSVDENQDGVPDLTAQFSNGIPSTLVSLEGGVAYHFTYAPYPFVSNASFTVNGTTTSYTLQPERVMIPLFGATPKVPTGPDHFPPVVSSVTTPSKEELFAFAVEVAKSESGKAQPVSLWKKSLDNILVLEKEWNNGRYDYRAVYHGGVKFSAEIDIDHDGYYEVHESYHNGRLSKLTYDGDHKGVPQFILTLDPNPVLEWDFNQDGLIDEIEKRVNAHTTELEFSTKMNGVFDVVTKEAPQ